jgi:hypothetical protein
MTASGATLSSNNSKNDSSEFDFEDSLCKSNAGTATFDRL